MTGEDNSMGKQKLQKITRTKTGERQTYKWLISLKNQIKALIHLTDAGFSYQRV